MKSLEKTIEEKYQKKQVADVRSGDTVRVHQKIKEGNKERVQVFEGTVIRTKHRRSLNSSITVRRIASGVGVEKSFLLHSPLVEKVEVVKRSNVNRNYLTYMRKRAGKSARLDSVEFDRDQANAQEAAKLLTDDPEPETQDSNTEDTSKDAAEEQKTDTTDEAEKTKEAKQTAEKDETNASDSPPDSKTTDNSQTKDASTEQSDSDKSED